MRRFLQVFAIQCLAETNWALAGGEGGGEAQQMQAKNEQALQSMLTGPQRQRFDRFLEMDREKEQYEREEAFVIGFRTGMQLMVEAMGGDDAYFATRPLAGT